MTPRERVRAALSHEEPDRVPVDLGQAVGDGIVIDAYQNLLRHLGLAGRPVHRSKRENQTATVDEDILRRFHVDFRRVDLGTPDHGGHKHLPGDSYQDEWGVIRTRPREGFYYDVTHSPLAEGNSLSALERYPWPNPYDPGRFRGLRDRAGRLHEETDYAVVLDLNSSFFLRCGELRGWENFYADLAGNAPFAEALMDRYLDIKLAIAGRALEEVGDCVDVVVISSDDLAGTTGTIISPQLYRSLIKPRQKRTFDFFRARTSARRLYHSDGAIYPLIGDLIEIGMEALNPVQVSAKGMADTKALKAEFGQRLTFWGGIDTHTVLPHGTPDDVRREVRTRIQDLGPGGGYVLCSVHNVQPDVPPENVVAMLDAAYEFGSYPLRRMEADR